MHQQYSDILALSDQPPVFWQEGGVPRFTPFTPSVAPDIYADEVALVRIQCQSCGHPFDICFTSSGTTRLVKALRATRIADEAARLSETFRLSALIKKRSLQYGDPPNIGCCAAGASMTSDTVRVLEFHTRHHQQYVKDGVITDIKAYNIWKRVPELEVEFEIVA